MIIEESHFILVNIYFIEYFGGSHGANMILFKQEFEKAYFILRKNGKDLITLIRILLSSGLPEISRKSIKHLNMTLALSKIDK
jgi:hypothetical protein